MQATVHEYDDVPTTAVCRARSVWAVRVRVDAPAVAGSTAGKKAVRGPGVGQPAASGQFRAILDRPANAKYLRFLWEAWHQVTGIARR